MGTPDFAVPALKKLITTEDVVLVVTQPDKPKGRGYTLQPSPVKQTAVDAGIEVYQPQTLKDEAVVEKLRELKPDVIIVAAYGKILPESILNIPPLGCINIHASLLPKYRGAAPINRAIMDGETVGGVTIMYMEKGLDTGDIILRKPVDIPPDMTAGEYHSILSALGADAMVETLENFKNGRTTRTKQDDNLATYAAKIDKSECEIDFTLPASVIVNHIRGLSPFPGAYTEICGKRTKLYGAVESNGKGKPGEILQADCSAGCLEIACGEGSIMICDVQPEGCRLMSTKAYLTGRKIKL